MPKSYYCDVCEYGTKDSGNYFKHRKSKKHKRNIENPPVKIPKTPKKKCICLFCNAEYTRLDNLKRHESKCSQKIVLEKNRTIQEKNAELKLKNIELKKKEKEIRQKDEDIHYYRQILLLSEENGSKTTSVFKFITQNYPNANPLKKMSYDEFKRVNNMEFENNGLSHDDQFVEDILCAFRQRVLHENIGRVIVKIYKKDDPNEQSIWNTDESRLKYVVKKTTKDNISRWVADKKGVYTSEQLISPLTKSLKQLLINYNERHCCIRRTRRLDRESSSSSSSSAASDDGDSDTSSEFDFDKSYEITDPLDNYIDVEKIKRNGATLFELMREIDNKKIDRKILKFMAPFFHAEKSGIKNKWGKYRDPHFM
jgi:hypothetical protein